MLTSSNSLIPFYYDHQSPNSSEAQNEETPFILNFSSSFDENESPLCQIFSRHKPMAKDHQESNNNNNNIVSTSKKKCNELETNEAIKQPRRRKNHDLARKRTGKKDRHSKICTAQGVRDRRMRLSLPIARKFFDLQDMLGFDKASKTIEWLFSKSRKEIKKLIINHHLPPSNHPSYLNDDEYVVVNDDDDDDVEEMDEMITNEKEEISKSRKVMTNNHKNAKESREKARERARERTKEKMKIKRSKLWYDSKLYNNNELDQPLSYNNFHDSQKGVFHEGHAHHTIENLGSFDGNNNLIQMDIHQTYNFENNVEIIVPHEIDCNYTNNGLMGINLGNWANANGNRMNPSSIGATSNMISFTGNNTTSIWCLPSSRTFPFSLQ